MSFISRQLILDSIRSKTWTIMHRSIIINRKPLRLWPYGVHWSYAEKGGGPVLRDNANWRKINGICISVPNFRIWFLFRRRLL